VRALVAERSDTISHAYVLMKIDDPARRAELAAQIARGELSLARLKEAVRGESEHPSLGAPAVTPVAAAAPTPFAVDTPAPAQTQAFAPIIEATPLTSAPLRAALPAASDAGLTAARESLGNAIEELATILHAIDRTDGSVKLNHLDRTNMAKWLQIARNKLDNLAAILRQKGE